MLKCTIKKLNHFLCTLYYSVTFEDSILDCLMNFVSMHVEHASVFLGLNPADNMSH